MCRMAGAAPVEVGPPPRAARAERVPARVLLRPDDDSACLGPTASVVPRPPSGRGASNIRRTRRMVSWRDRPCGVKRLLDFHNDATQRNCKRYVIAEPVH